MTGFIIFLAILFLGVAFIMAATQKARGYNFWKYFIISYGVLWAFYFLITKLINSHG